MQFIQGVNRHQTYFTTIDEQISSENSVRLVDAFIDKLDLAQLGFTSTIHKSEGFVVALRCFQQQNKTMRLEAS